MTARRVVFALILLTALAAASSPWWRPEPRPGSDVNALAERYVRLVVALGQHDRDYVDAYYGPPEWRKEAELTNVSLDEIDEASADLTGDLAATAPAPSAPEPLFTPQSLIAEGTGDYGVQVAFPGLDRVAFAQSVVFPAAGLDPSTAAGYYDVVDLVERLAPAGDEAARRYLDGRLDAEGAIQWLETHALHSRARARQRLAFIDQYRSYVINYTVGKDIVARWVESQGGTDADPVRRWELFEEIISSPRLPSSLATPNSQLPTPK